MSKMMENVKTVNSVTRTAIFLTLSGFLGYGGFVGYKNYIKPGIEAKDAIAKLDKLEVELQENKAQLEESRAENGRLQTSLQLLKVDRRVAKIEVLEVSKNDAQEPTMNVRFIEFDSFGDTVGEPRDFELRGDTMYIDCWVVKFGDKYIEQSDALRSASLCVFNGIFGNLDGPEGAKLLDTESTDDFPSVYTRQERTSFAEQIWADFWRIANDKASQDELGIRAMHGQANYVKVEPGKTYEATVRSSGAISLVPLRD